jgi:tetratricopeptide (TPR) repeat protein
MAWRGGRAKEARELFDEAQGAFEAEGLGASAARVSAHLAEIDFREGHTLEAVARLEAALDALGGEEPTEDVAVVAAQLGRFLVLSGQLPAAVPRLELALELAEALQLREVFAQALTSKSILFTARNRLEEARILLQGALDLALAHDLTAAALRGYNNLAVVLESADRYAEALALSDRGLELARRAGHRLSEVSFLGAPISALVLIGRWDEALSRAAEFESMAGWELVKNVLTPMVEVHCQRGSLAEARSLLGRLASLRDSDDIQSRAAFAIAEASVLRVEGKLREALDAVEPGLEVRPDLGITSLSVKLSFVEALEAAFALGDTARVQDLLEIVEALRPGERPPLLEAHAHRFRAWLAGDASGFKAAAALFRELELRFWLGVTLLEHAELTGDRASLAEAREIFEELGARPWIDRVDAAPAPEPARA